jgi:hypothetical protein
VSKLLGVIFSRMMLLSSQNAEHHRMNDTRRGEKEQNPKLHIKKNFSQQRVTMRTSFALFVSFGIAAANAWTVNDNNPQQHVVDYTKLDFEDFMEGLVQGAFETADPLAETCIKNGEDMLLQISQAVQDLKDGSKESVEAGVQLIGQVIQEASSELVDCEIAVDTFEKLFELASSFSHPLAFAFKAGKNILINHVEISDEIHAAVEAWDAPDFFTFGFNVGEALAQVLIGSSEGEFEGEASVRVE